jgi:hexokinase
MSQRQSVPLVELRHCNQNQAEAVKELEQQFCLDNATLLKVVESFQNELVAGLVDDRSSDLNMIPTYVTGKAKKKKKSMHSLFC